LWWWWRASPAARQGYLIPSHPLEIDIVETLREFTRCVAISQQEEHS